MSKHQQIVVDQFTRQSVPFSQSLGHLDDDSLHILMEFATLTSEDTVLDVACGTGIVACAFATIALQVTGVDITPAMLEQAKLLAAKRGLQNLSWRHGDIETLPFSDDAFSIVLSRYAFHHFLNPQAVFSEIVRVCRPCGRILIADATPSPDQANAFNQFEKLFDPSHNRALTKAV